MSYKNIPFGTVDKFNVVIEISTGSQNKYEYDEELDAIKLDFVFTGDFHYPFNYGYIPQTLGGDGDHLDVIVLTAYPIAVGTIVEARAIGMIELLDRGEEDNKIIAVPVADGASTLKTWQDVSEQQLEQFRKFCTDVSIQKNKTVEIVSFHDETRAKQELERGRKNYRR